MKCAGSKVRATAVSIANSVEIARRRLAAVFRQTAPASIGRLAPLRSIGAAVDIPALLIQSSQVGWQRVERRAREHSRRRRVAAQNLFKIQRFR